MAAPTITSVVLSADNSTATVTFSEAVYNTNAGSGDLEASDFSLSLSGGNTSLISLNATPSGISKTSQSVWVLTLNGTDLDFAPDGNETLVVDSANDTSIYNAAGEAHTAAHGGQSLNDRTRFVKFRITNLESATRFFYADVGGGTGDDSSDYVLIGSAASGATLTSSVFSLDKFFGSGKNNQIAINSSKTQANLATGYAGGAFGPTTTDAMFISSVGSSNADNFKNRSYQLEHSRKLVAYGAGNPIQNTSIGSDGIQTGSSNQNKAKYLNITRPSGGPPNANQDTYGAWTQFDVNNTQLDTIGPALLTASLPTNTSLKLVFDSKPVDSDGSNLTNSDIKPYSSAFVLTQLESDGSTDNDSVKRTTTGSLVYSTTNVTDDTITIPIDYEGVIESGDKLKFRLNTSLYRDIHNNPGSSSQDSNGVIGQYFSGTLAYPSTGSTGTFTYEDINFHFVNSHGSATAHFYIRVDASESGSQGSNVNSAAYLSLGTVAAGQTGSFAVSDIYFDDAKRGDSSPVHRIYAHTASVTLGDLTGSPTEGTHYLDILTLNQYSSSTQPFLTDNRRNFSASFDGSEWTTQLRIFEGSSTSELDYYVNTGVATLDSQTSGTGSVTIDWGERVRAKTTGGTPSSTSDLSGGLPNNIFRITQNTGSTDTISNLRITSGSLQFATSARTGIASGSWTFTFNYDGLADGTERLLLQDRFEFYNGFYDDELNTAGNGEYWSELDTSFPDSWENFGTQRGFALSQDALATEVTESLTAADGGTVKAGGTNDSPAATVIIPAGALKANSTITVTTSGDRNPAGNGIGQNDRVGVVAYSPLIEVTPHEQQLNSAATIKFTLDGSVAGTCPSDLIIMKRNHSTGVWYPLPSSLWSCSSGEITITTTRFNQYQAIGGTEMARTKINNSTLGTLTQANLVSGSAITFTGSAQIAITDDSVFLIQEVGDVPKSITAESMATYFAGEITVSSSESQNENFRLTFIDPTANRAGLVVDGDADKLVWNPSSDTLTVGGAISGATIISGSGDSTIHKITMNQLVAATADINGGSIDGATIGASSQSSVKATTLSGSSTLDVAGISRFGAGNQLTISAAGLLSGSATATLANATLDQITVGSADINGGAIDGATIGASSQSSIKATTISGSGTADFAGQVRFGTENQTTVSSVGLLSSSATATLANATLDQITVGSADINGGAIDGATIGASSQSSVKATTLSGSGNLSVEGASSFGPGALVSITNAGVVSGSGTSTLHQLDADRITVEVLDVNTINSNTVTQNVLEVQDFTVVAGVSGSSANLSNGGFQIGGGAGSDGLGALVWNDSEAGLRILSGTAAAVKINSAGSQFAGIISGSGVLTVPGVTVGTAVLDESDLEKLDDITAGTVLASKAVVASPDKDITGFRSITASADVYADKFFGDGAGLTNVGATIEAASEINESLQLVFASGTTAVGTSAGLFIDSGSLSYNISTNALQSPIFSGSGDSTVHKITMNQLVAATADINGGTVDGAAINDTTIGATTPSSIKATTISGSGTADFAGQVRFGTENQLTVSTVGLLSGSATATLHNATLDQVTVGSADINGGTVDGAAINNTTIGATTQSSVKATTLSGSSTLNVAGIATFGAGEELTISAASVLSGSQTATLHNATLDRVTVGDADINGGAIDGATIGASSQSSIKATTISGSGTADFAGQVRFGTENQLTVSTVGLLSGSATATLHNATLDQVTVGSADINGGAIDGATIGASSQSSVKATTLSGSSNLDVAGIASFGAGGELTISAASVLSASQGATLHQVSVDRLTVSDPSGATSFISGAAGDGLIASAGTLKIEPVEQILFSGSANMSLNAITASLTATPVDSSIQVFLNGVLQTNSGSLPEPNPGVFDYKIQTASNQKKVIMEAALDSDDILTIAYIKKFSNS